METVELVIQLSKLVGGIFIIYYLYKIEKNTR